jgi:hypothetical protein
MPTISMTPEAAVFPSTNFPELKKDGQGRLILAFDPTTKESCWWKFACPAFSGTPEVIISYYMTNAAGDVDLDVEVEAISDGDTIDMDSAESFDTANVVDGTPVPGTQGYPDQVTVTLTNDDGMAADDMLRIQISRDAPNDSSAGELHFVMAHLKYN